MDPSPHLLLKQMGSLADTTRLRLLRVLDRHELGVAELCDVLQLPQSTVSRHLKLLGDHHWTCSRREGTTNRYRMILDDLEPHARELWVLARDQTKDWDVSCKDKIRLERHLEKRRKKSQAFFRQTANQWDQIRCELYGEAFVYSGLLALLPKEWVVADLGCGTGSITAELAKHVHKVIAVDQSPKMLEAARERTGDLKNVQLKHGQLERIPIESGSCDAALIILTLTYVADPSAALNEAGRVLRGGGRLVIVDLLPHERDDFKQAMGQHWMGFDPTELSAMVGEAGFCHPQAQPLPPEINTKGPGLMLVSANKRDPSF